MSSRAHRDGTAQGRPRSALDTIIAAIEIANDCIVVTDNEDDFYGVKLSIRFDITSNELTPP